MRHNCFLLAVAAAASMNAAAAASMNAVASASNEACSNSDYWAKNGETCAWVAEDADDRCSKEGFERVAVACANACGPNHNDFHDSETFTFKHKKKQRDCAWLAKKKWKRM